MWRTVLLGALLLLAAGTACGSKTKGKSTAPVGEGGSAGEPTVRSAWGGGTEASPYAAGDEPVEGAPDAGPATQITAPAEPPPPVTFELKNAGQGDLVFAIDKGWQPVIFAYTGKPPKAKPALLFPTHCTVSCDAPLEEMCPVCEMEEANLKKRKQKELEETRREVAPAGGVVSVPWDGQVYVYEKAPKAAKKRGCKCWRKAPPAPELYTVKACGLRPSTKPGEPTRPVCAETQVQLPPAQTPATITLTFGDPK